MNMLHIVLLAIVIFIILIVLFLVIKYNRNFKYNVKNINVGQIYIMNNGSNPFDENSNKYEIIDVKYDRLGNKWIKYKFNHFEYSCLAETFLSKNVIRIS